MADDNNARYRSDDTFGRGPSTAGSANDPLAELARLIGRNDPFSDYGQKPAVPPPAAQSAYPSTQAQPVQPPQPDEAPHSESSAAPSYDNLPAPQFGSDPAPSFLSRPAPQYDSEPPRYSEPAPPSYGQEPARGYSSDFPSHNDWPGSPAAQPTPSYQPAPAYQVRDPFPLPPQPQYPAAAPRYEQQAHEAPNFESRPFADPRGRPPGLNFQSGRPPFDPPGYPGAQERGGFGAPHYPHDPGPSGMPPPHEEEFYDDEPRGGRRRGLLTVVAVLGLAVVGTAGAFGYRSLFGGSGASSPPPVIRASGEPSKVAPPPATADASPSKFSYDRFGDAGKDEQVVKREEKPVDLSKAQPRSVFPGAPVVTNSPTSKTPAAGAVTAGTNPPSAIGEPRRVRTVPIRPDQGDTGAAASPAQQPPTSVAPPRQANAAVAPDASPRASSRVAMRQPVPAPAPAGNAPLSLAPDANNNAMAQPSAQELAPPPPAPSRAAPPPARIASAPAAPAASGGAGYLVQVSSQKSEADAESAYRGIQSKYPGVLGSQPHQVRRADLGAKGVYYRAMVGPFGSREEAVQLCSSLKQAGGDCVVQH